MDGAEADRWSAVAEDWSRLWGRTAAPVWDAVVRASGVRPPARVLDVGCGAGDLLADLAGRGFTPAGVDPAPGMLALARSRLPGADLRRGDAEALPWPDASFDLVTVVNALQFARDADDAVAELARVSVPGGSVAVAVWAEDSRNDLAAIEAALAVADGEEPLGEGDLRAAGELEELLTDGGLALVEAGLVELEWRLADSDDLVSAVLLGEDDATRAAKAPVVLDAARRFRGPGGAWVLGCAFRYAVARRPLTPRAPGASPAPA